MKDELDPVNPNGLIIRILEKIQADAQTNREELQAEIRALGTRIDETNVRIDETNARLDQTNAHMGAMELTLVDLATQQRTTVSVLRDLRQRVSVLETGSG